VLKISEFVDKHEKNSLLLMYMAKRRVSSRKLTFSVFFTILAALGLTLAVMFVNGMFGSFDIRNQAAGNTDASVKCEKGFYSAFDSADILNQSDWSHTASGNTVANGQLVQTGSPEGAWLAGAGKQKGDLYATAKVTSIDFPSQAGQSGIAVLQLWHDGDNYINLSISRRQGKNILVYSLEKDGQSKRKELEIGAEFPIDLTMKRQGNEAEFTYVQQGKVQIFDRVSDVYTGEVTVALLSQTWGDANLPLTVQYDTFYLSCPNKTITCSTPVNDSFSRLNKDLWSGNAGNSTSRSALHQLAKSESEGVWLVGKSHVAGDFMIDAKLRALTKSKGDNRAAWSMLETKYDDNQKANITWLKQDGHSYLRLQVFKDGQMQESGLAEVPEQNIPIRLERQGSVISASYRKVGETNYQALGSFESSTEPMNFTFLTQTSGPRAAGLIDDFRLACPTAR